MRRTAILVTVTILATGPAGAGTWEPLGPPGALPTRLATSPDGAAVAFTDGGGVWLSRDGGLAWEEAPLPPAHVLDLLFDPVHPGDPIALVEGCPGLGDRPAVVIGRDGGREWTLRWSAPGGSRLYRAVPDPWLPGALVVAGALGERGVFRLLPGGGAELLLALPDGIAGLAAVPGRGLWVLPAARAPRLSTDGGERWAEATDPSHGAQSAIASSPLDPEVVVVGDDAALYTSTDGGSTWATWPTDGPIRRVAFSTADPALVWAVGPQVLLRSTDGGLSWRRMPLRDGSYTDVLPDPRDPAAVWLAATVPPRGIPWPGVLRSDDGGRTFRLATDGLEAMPVTAVLPSPDGAPLATVIRTPSGDLALDAAGWRRLAPVDGVPADALARDPRDPRRLYATAFASDADTSGDTLFVSDDGGRTWRRAAPPVPRAWFFELAPDPYDPDVVLAAGRFGVVAFHPVTGSWTGALTGEASADTVVFLPDAPGVALAAGGEWGAMYRSTDHGRRWTQVAAPELPRLERWHLVAAAGGRVYLHTPEGGGTLLASDDAGESWRRVPLPAAGCGPPASSPGAHHDLVVACAPGRRGWGLYLSSDGGHSWRAIPGPPGLAARTVAWDPSEPGWVWVGTARHGLWRGRLPAAARRPAGRLPLPGGQVAALRTPHGAVRIDGRSGSDRDPGGTAPRRW